MSGLTVDRHRNSPGPVSTVLSTLNPIRIVGNNPAPSAVGAVIGTSIFNSTAAASEVLNQTMRVGSITAAVATGLQFGSDSIYWLGGHLSLRDVGVRTVGNVAANSLAVVGGTGGSAVGGALGTALMPGTGTVVGSVVGGVCGSVSFGTLARDKLLRDWRVSYSYNSAIAMRRQRNDKEVLENAMRYFGHSTGDLADYDLLNMESISIKYREYAKVCHPDRGGSKNEWIELVNNFAVVTDAIRKRDRSLPAGHKGSELRKLRKQLQEKEAAFMKEKENYEKQIEALRQSNASLEREMMGNGGDPYMWTM